MQRWERPISSFHIVSICCDFGGISAVGITVRRIFDLYQGNTLSFFAIKLYQIENILSWSLFFSIVFILQRQ